MEQEEIVLCGSSAYTKKFYLNPLFNGLPRNQRGFEYSLCTVYRGYRRNTAAYI